jgi:hypothetical protein
MYKHTPIHCQHHTSVQGQAGRSGVAGGRATSKPLGSAANGPKHATHTHAHNTHLLAAGQHHVSVHGQTGRPGVAGGRTTAEPLGSAANCPSRAAAVRVAGSLVAAERASMCESV